MTWLTGALEQIDCDTVLDRLWLSLALLVSPLYEVG